MRDRPADRASRALTYDPRMIRMRPPSPERDSIWGDTYGGVPNPNVPVVHGYPTRFHGPIFTVPQPGYTYAPATYTLAPFLGTEDAGSLQDTMRGFSLTGNSIADALIGAAVGYAAAPKGDRAIVYAAAGAAAMGFAGTIGLVGVLALGLYEAQRKGGLRPDLHKRGA
jgi:hypothetical protein